MQPRRLLGVFIMLAGISVMASATPLHLRCEYRQNPLGIDTPEPHLSWQSDNSERNWKQAAYQILVASSVDLLRAGRPDVWDSGKTESDESIGIAYKGPLLESRKRYYWAVRAWDTAGHMSDSTEEAWWEMGLLQPSDWKASWIYWKNPDDEADRAGMRWIWLASEDAFAAEPKKIANFRVSFKLSERPRTAALTLAVRGDFIAKVNGHPVDSKHGWGAFDWRDISDELVVGNNSVEVTVTAPQAPERAPEAGATTVQAGLAALVKVTAMNGTILRFPTDQHWMAASEGSSNWQQAKVVADLQDKRLGDPGPLPEPAAYLRRVFPVAKSARRARLYVTALGSYRVFLNGQRVGADVMTPDFTDYRKRVLYQVYDVSNLLRNGSNVIAALLGDGWYGSGLTWVGMHFFPPPDRFLGQLELDYSDGSHESVLTDASWKASPSAIRRSDLYGGEVYDARLEQRGWQQTGFNDSTWKPATVADTPEIAVSSQLTDPVRVVLTLRPKQITPLPNGTYLFDMGQNMVGWVTLKVKGVAGSRVRLRFAEILNPDGTIYTANLRNADATDEYVLRGEGDESFAPHFTFHGFRYVEVTGFPGTPSLDSIQGEVVSSLSGNPGGTLTTASNLVNRMWTIGIWASAEISSAFRPTVPSATSVWDGWAMRGSSGGPAHTILILLPSRKSSFRTSLMRKPAKAPSVMSLLTLFRPQEKQPKGARPGRKA